MKKLIPFILLLSFFSISCSSDFDLKKEIYTKEKNDKSIVPAGDNKLILKDNLSNLNYSIRVDPASSEMKNSFTQKNLLYNSSGANVEISVNFDGNKLFLISSTVNNLHFYIEQINETDFYLLDEEKNKMQKVAVSLDENFNFNLKTTEIYSDNNNESLLVRGQWYSCMRERLGDPINIGILGFTSFLGPVALAGAFTGIGLYCAF
ncbi:hypothetical protein [Myroides sp. DW712]|uniref:hypothetical protein n=1 Tax=Myroides sp. DW712 TaxID=3389800 RepID=UPI00397AC2B5